MDERLVSKIVGLEEKYITGRKEGLENLTIDDIDFNPYLFAALHLDTPRKIAEFAINQRIERGVTTSFGYLMNDIVKQLPGITGSGVKRSDVCLTKNNIRYYIQIASGPKTKDHDAVDGICRNLQSAIKLDRGSFGLIGITYGTKDRLVFVQNGIKDTVIGVKIGNEFWIFLTDNKNFAKDLFDVMYKASSNISGYTDKDLLENKTKELTNAIQKKYGDGGKEMMDKLFHDNMIKHTPVHKIKHKKSRNDIRMIDKPLSDLA